MNSVDRGEKFQFNLGKQEVIKGWDQGVATMTRGEVGIVTIVELGLSHSAGFYPYCAIMYVPFSFFDSSDCLVLTV